MKTDDREIDWEKQDPGLRPGYDGGDLCAWNEHLALCTGCGRWYEFDEIHIGEQYMEGGGCDRWRFMDLKGVVACLTS